MPSFASLIRAFQCFCKLIGFNSRMKTSEQLNFVFALFPSIQLKTQRSMKHLHSRLSLMLGRLLDTWLHHCWRTESHPQPSNILARMSWLRHIVMLRERNLTYHAKGANTKAAGPPSQMYMRGCAEWQNHSKLTPSWYQVWLVFPLDMPSTRRMYHMRMTSKVYSESENHSLCTTCGPFCYRMWNQGPVLAD